MPSPPSTLPHPVGPVGGPEQPWQGPRPHPEGTRPHRLLQPKNRESKPLVSDRPTHTSLTRFLDIWFG